MGQAFNAPTERMNFSAFFIDRPVATTLLSLGVALAGGLSYGLLPVAPLPQVSFPTISVQANLPGASPEMMAATVARLMAGGLRGAGGNAILFVYSI